MTASVQRAISVNRFRSGCEPPLVRRTLLRDAALDRLYFAQVREDPLLEIEALAPAPTDTIAVVGSGGCTALSLLAAGAGRVVAIDLNMAQGNLIELKLLAVCRLPRSEAIAFLGGAAMDRQTRMVIYAELRSGLTAAARSYWDSRRAAVGRGVLACGVSERFISLVVAAVRRLIHDEQRISRLLACATLEEQRELYEREWDSRRWRMLFPLLLNRWVFRRTYSPAFFENVENPSFARHFHALVRQALTELPVRDNYFLHQMLTGRYPDDVPGGVPPYLGESGSRAVAQGAQRFELVDGSFTAWLAGAPPASVQGFCLSNICEWLDEQGVDHLFSAIARTAAPGARICFRNFVGWTDLPPRWRTSFEIDEALRERLSRADRSLVQRRFVLCRYRGAAA